MSGISQHAALPGLLTIAEREQLLLAPFAQHSVDSRGRRYPEQDHPYRGPYQRDRDRILHSAAFRRLADKTQVFTRMGDYHRTRLTHTMEVASIARTISRALRLNEDLTEALALVHDLGHPPFGHAGEEVLDELLADEGGFSHNRQALTIVEQLEQRYCDFPGLNLTWELLESQTTRIDKAAFQPLLEAQVVDVADSITYDAHDTDDAVQLGLVSLEELLEIPLAGQCAAAVASGRPALDDDLVRKALVRQLIDQQVSDVLARTGFQLAEASFTSAKDLRQANFELAPSDEMRAQKETLEAFLYERVYRHEEIMRVRQQGQQQLRRLFEVYLDNPQWLPEKFVQRSEQTGLRRAVADYVAGMTEGYFRETFARVFP